MFSVLSCFESNIVKGKSRLTLDAAAADTGHDILPAEKEQQEREAKETERTKALDEVESAYKHYLELKDAYVKKYHSDSALNTANDLLSELIALLFKD